MVQAPLAQSAACAQAAAEQEGLAATLDASGRSVEAIQHYKLAVASLTEAAVLCPDWHTGKKTLDTHLAEVKERVAYLESMKGSAALVPYEHHVEAKQLNLNSKQGIEGCRTIGTAAAVGAACGLIISGATFAATFAVVAVHFATRDDSTGHLVRQLGRGGADAWEMGTQRAGRKLKHLVDKRGAFYQDALLHAGEFAFLAETLILHASTSLQLKIATLRNDFQARKDKQLC